VKESSWLLYAALNLTDARLLHLCPSKERTKHQDPHSAPRSCLSFSFSCNAGLLFLWLNHPFLHNSLRLSFQLPILQTERPSFTYLIIFYCEYQQLLSDSLLDSIILPLEKVFLVVCYYFTSGRLISAVSRPWSFLSYSLHEISRSLSFAIWAICADRMNHSN
jgi:hypothetical protein